MSLYSVNFAKNVVPDAGRRRKYYWLMVAYFGLCGVLLVEGALRAARHAELGNEARAEVARITKGFKATHESGGGLKEYADQMKVRLAKQHSQILALNRDLPTEVPLVQVLYYLTQTMSDEVSLLSFKYNDSSRSVDVKCQLFIGERRSVSSTALLAMWRDDQDLAGYVKDIRLVNLEENIFVEGRPAVVLNSRMELQ